MIKTLFKNNSYLLWYPTEETPFLPEYSPYLETAAGSPLNTSPPASPTLSASGDYSQEIEYLISGGNMKKPRFCTF